VVMIHTGSVSVGYPASGYMQDILREIYPKSLKYPENGIFPLPVSEKYAAQWANFRMALRNAANFAFCNRMFLGLMMRMVFEEVLGDREFRLLYDSGHNLVWDQEIDGETQFLHRKGACPARGAEQMQGTPFYWTGEPALIPGSMGASSFIMAGKGHAGSMGSASHGAGRSMSRGKSMRVEDAEFEAFIKRFSIVTPIDPESPAVVGRSMVLKKWRDEIKQEAPWAFKDIGPVIDTQVAAGMVGRVVETEPIFTVKG
ncbi:MAG: RtcB family protein, partial [Bacteroidota bacterium]